VERSLQALRLFMRKGPSPDLARPSILARDTYGAGTTPMLGVQLQGVPDPVTLSSTTATISPLPVWVETLPPLPIAGEASSLIGNVVRPPWKVDRLNQPRVAVPVAGVDVRPIGSNCIPNAVFPAESVLLCAGTAAAPSRPGPHAPPGERTSECGDLKDMTGSDRRRGRSHRARGHRQCGRPDYCGPDSQRASARRFCGLPGHVHAGPP